MGGGNGDCNGGVGLGGAGLNCGVGPLHDFPNVRLDDTVVGGGWLIGVTLLRLKLLTLLLQDGLLLG